MTLQGLVSASFLLIVLPFMCTLWMIFNSRRLQLCSTIDLKSLTEQRKELEFTAFWMLVLGGSTMMILASPPPQMYPEAKEMMKISCINALVDCAVLLGLIGYFRGWIRGISSVPRR